MASTTRPLLLTAALALGALASLAGLAHPRPAWAQDTATSKPSLEQRVALLSKAAESFKALAAEPPPKAMTAKDKAAYEEHTAWLLAGAKRLAELVAKGNVALDLAKAKSKASAEAQQSFTMQYLALQSAMQDEAKRFTVLSNMMKTKHDTAKNTISNIR